MASFWRIGTGAVLLFFATPATAQHYDNAVANEIVRASNEVRESCEYSTRLKREYVEKAFEAYEAGERFESRVNDLSPSALEAEEAALQRRIMLARARGDREENTGPNSLGDMIRNLDTVQRRRKNEPTNTEFGRRTAREHYETEAVL